MIKIKKNCIPIEVSFEPEEIDNMTLYECAFCNHKAAFKTKVDKVMGSGKGMFIIENIPAYHCNDCQQQYIDGTTMTVIDSIRKCPEVYAVKRKISVVSLDKRFSP